MILGNKESNKKQDNGRIFSENEERFNYSLFTMVKQV